MLKVNIQNQKEALDMAEALKLVKKRCDVKRGKMVKKEEMWVVTNKMAHNEF